MGVAVFISPPRGSVIVFFRKEARRPKHNDIQAVLSTAGLSVVFLAFDESTRGLLYHAPATLLEPLPVEIVTPPHKFSPQGLCPW